MNTTSGNAAKETKKTPRSAKDRGEKHRLGSQIIETLKQRILHWDYPPGHPLGEESLSQEFAVSRSPVREALHALEVEGFVCRMPNRTYVVKQISLAEVQDLYDLRLALETYAVTGLQFTPEVHARLQGMLANWKAMDEQQWDGKAMAKADEAFHEGLAALYGNKVLLDSLKTINQRLFIFRTIDFEQQDRFANTSRQHTGILEALLAGDRESALKALKQNVEYGRLYVDQSIRDALVRAYANAP